LDTKGPWFVAYELTMAEAPKDTPRIGFVDARATMTAEERKSRQLHRDLSRNRSGSFAVSLSPGCGRIYASEPQPPVNSQAEACCTALLKWNQFTIGDPSKPDNPPIRAGFLIENHEVILFRGNIEDEWRSSGVVLENLPRQIIPAFFMSSFIGQTKAKYLYMWNSAPEVWCSCCDYHCHGFEEGWQICP